MPAADNGSYVARGTAGRLFGPAACNIRCRYRPLVWTRELQVAFVVAILSAAPSAHPHAHTTWESFVRPSGSHKRSQDESLVHPMLTALGAAHAKSLGDGPLSSRTVEYPRSSMSCDWLRRRTDVASSVIASGGPVVGVYHDVP